MNIDEKTTVAEYMTEMMIEEWPRALARAWLIRTETTDRIFASYITEFGPFFRAQKPIPDVRAWMHAAAAATRRELTLSLHGRIYLR